MSRCDEISARMALYLDDELLGDERVLFEEHLDGCRACRDRLESDRRFLQSVRGARPLYDSPPELLEVVRKTLGDSQSAPARTRKPSGAVNPALVRAATGLAFSPGRRILTACLILLFLAGFGLLYLIRRNRTRPPSEFATMAVETHMRHLRGQLPFEIASDSPEQISGWFAGKVSFSLTLPNYEEPAGEEKPYRLEGARLVAFKSDYAAYVAYKMKNRPISLVVTSDSIALPSGGEEIVSKNIIFHYDSIDGLKVITWADRGLTYALVSDLEARGQQSCIVCHLPTADKVSIAR
jgi:anti-sigma factor RsiW